MLLLLHAGEQEKTVIPQDTFLFPDETLDGGNREYPSDSDDSFEILEKPTMVSSMSMMGSLETSDMQ